ncbi:hypothetical protein EGW08_010815 [Elysia chlorotica]|uniref:Mitogen-activated protein kinase n=1 Tax=Elysia chlorotica TaxID=188477 RepID=A0A433TIT8_ELYCH|nr:hypothetical protein EGW08_010815 [Elysia chlorotica]
MSHNHNVDDKKTSAVLGTSKTGKTMGLEQIMAKRSLDVKFDLTDSDYKPVENIGIGAYGVVCSAIHVKSKDRVAIKKIPHVFDALTIAKRTYREIKILKHFKHDNIICIREILKPKETTKDFKDIYVVFDLMESDLHRIIYSKQDLSEEHVRYFLYQILRGLKYIHSANVIHRDLKPSNLLVNEDSCLFFNTSGMARGISYTPNEPSYFMTQYVATRWYRAPEILLSMLEYGTAVDMWSVGCIFAEMMGRKHLFPGKDYLTQVKLILGVLGTPSEKIMNNCQNDILKRIIKSFGKKGALEWSKLFPKASKKSIDLLGKMLVLDPSERITPERALSHRLLNNYHDPDDEPICVPAFNFDFEKEDMDKRQLRSVIMEEVMSFHEPKPSAPALSFSAFLRPAPKDDPALSDIKQNTELSNTSEEKQSAGNNNSSNRRLIYPQHTQLTNYTPKPVPVSLDPSLLGGAAPTDVEMLSAQSTMDVQDFGAELERALAAGEAEAKEDDSHSQQPGEDKGIYSGKASDKKQVTAGNTISEDTKALVKQALMNATQRRQQAESQDSKPVTAMQRQKEREEKRRKKKERALEKIKKNKNKKGAPQETSHFLSSQDMELLRRWTSMQNPAGSSYGNQDSGSNSNSNSNSSPPHPGPSVSPNQGPAPPPLDRSNSCSSSLAFGGGISFVGPGSVAHQVLPKGKQVLGKAGSVSSLPLALSKTLRFSSAENTSGATVLIPSAQLGALGQANFIPVLAIPSTITPGKVEIKRILPQQQQQQQQQPPLQQKRQLKPASSQDPTVVGLTHSTQSASESTRTLLQNVLRERKQGSSVSQASFSNPSPSCQTPVENTHSPSTTTGFNFAITSHTGDQLSLMPASEAPIKIGTPTVSAISRHLPTVDMSTTNPKSNQELTASSLAQQETGLSPLGSAGADFMEFLDQLKDSSFKLPSAGSSASLKSPPLSAFGQNSAGLSSHQQSHNSNIHTHTGLSTSDSSQEDCLPSQDSVGLNQNTMIPATVGHEQVLSRPERSSLPFLSYSQETSGQESVRPNRFSVPETSYKNDHSNNLNQQNLNSFPFTGFGGGSGSICTTQQQMPFPLANYTDSFVDTSQHQTFSSHQNMQQQPQHQYNQQQQQQHLNVNQSSGFLFQQSNFPRMPNAYPQQQNTVDQKSQQISYMQQQQQPQQHDHLLKEMSNTSRDPNRMPAAASTSTATTNSSLKTAQSQNQRQADLIALLSKQLSKAEVADIFPPALALTPRGTGAGYGVGMDLDSLLTDAQDGHRGENSPLSSSLLADWLDLSSNISHADLEALEREMALQSPMHVSYGELGL